jgi:hypothetical protein
VERPSMQARAEVARAVAGVHQPLTTQPGGRCLTRYLATIHRRNMAAGPGIARPGRRSVSTTGVVLRDLAECRQCPGGPLPGLYDKCPTLA